MTQWGNIIITMFMAYYTYKVINMLRTGTKNIQRVNNVLDRYRGKKVLTVDEQKEFINLKFGRSAANKFRWMSLLKSLPTLLLLIFLFIAYRYLIAFSGWTISLWISLVIIMVFPIIFSILLKLMGLTDNNVLVDLFWRNKK